jgi:hypothetical protein
MLAKAKGKGKRRGKRGALFLCLLPSAWPKRPALAKSKGRANAHKSPKHQQGRAIAQPSRGAAICFSFHFRCKCKRGTRAKGAHFFFASFAFCLLGFTPCSQKQRLRSQKQRCKGKSRPTQKQGTLAWALRAQGQQTGGLKKLEIVVSL